MKKFQTVGSYDHTIHPGETFVLPSLTQPDQTMTVRQIYDRFTRNLPIDGSKVSFFDDDPDVDLYLPDFDRLDISEKIAFMKQAADNIKAYKANYENARIEASKRKTPPVVEPKSDEPKIDADGKEKK